MVEKRLYVEITGKDDLSKVFSAVGKAAQEMGRTLESAGKGATDGLDRVDDAAVDAGRALDRIDGSATSAAQAIDRVERSTTETATALDRVDSAATDAGRALDSVDDAATTTGRALDDTATASESAGRSLRDLGDAGTQVGQGLGLLAGAFTMYASQARQSELAAVSLTRLYGEASAEMLAFAEQIQDTTIFSNDAARQAEVITGSLVNTYGLAADQARQLITTASDLASLYGRDLLDVTERITAAVRGEGESIEAIGGSLNDSAVAAYAAARGFTDFTTSTDEAAKAQVRFQYLMEQFQYSQGASAEVLESTTGQTQKLANEVQDLAARFVDFTGPVGQVAAGLGSFGVEAGIAVAGLARMAQGARTAVTAMGGLSAVAGPAGIALALGAAALAAYHFASSLGDDLDVKLRQVQDSASDVDITIATLTATMNDAALALTIGQGDAAIDRLRQEAEYYQYLVDTYADLPTDRLFLDTSGMDEATQASIEQHRAALEYIAQYEARFGSVANALDTAMAAQQDYNTILSHHGPGAQLALEATAALIDQWQAGIITTDQLVTGIDGIANGLGAYDQQALEATVATESFADAQAALRQQIDMTTVAIGEYLAAWSPGLVQGETFIAQARDIEHALGLIERAMTDVNETPQFELTGGEGALEQLKEDLLEIQTATEAGSGRVRAWADQLTDAFNAGLLTADEYANGIRELSERGAEFAAQVDLMAFYLTHVSVTAEEAAAAFGLVGDRIGETNKDVLLFGDTLSRIQQLTSESSEAANRHTEETRYQADALYELAAALGAVNDPLASWVANQIALGASLAGTIAYMEGLPQRIAEMGTSIERVSDRTLDWSLTLAETADLAGSGVTVWAGYEAALASLSEQFGLLTTNAQQFQAVGIGGQSIDVAVNLQTGGGDLERTFGTIVGQTNQMSQQLGQVGSWADKLIGDPGTWSQLDQLLEDGRISLEQYNEAQAAQVRISGDVENAQQDLLAVQAGLAPVIADATRRQAEYIDSLQNLDEQGQLAALGFMDQAQSMRALEIAQLAAAASTDGQRAATTAMITEMANADPVLAAMLEKMGLISVGADGTISVNFDEAASATEAIESLNSSIDRLIELIGDIFNVDTDTDAPQTMQAVNDLTGAINGIPKNVTTQVNLIDNASLRAAEIREVMALLDGTSATVTTYMNTVQTGPSLAGVARATGGTILPELPRVMDGIPHYANGGSHALVGEYGPEMVWLPTGSQVTHAGATDSRLAAMGAGRGDTISIYNGPVSQTVTYDQSSYVQRRRDLAAARRLR